MDRGSDSSIPTNTRFGVEFLVLGMGMDLLVGGILCTVYNARYESCMNLCHC